MSSLPSLLKHETLNIIQNFTVCEFLFVGRPGAPSEKSIKGFQVSGYKL